MLKYPVLFLLLWGLISCTNPSPSKTHPEDKIPVETQMVEIRPDIVISSADSFQLLKSWNKVMQALENTNTSLLEKYSFDTINCQACKSFPEGTNIEDIPIRRMLPGSFMSFYRDSFLFPKALKYFSTGRYTLDIFVSERNSIQVHRIRFMDLTSDRWKSSLQFYFVKTGSTFKFLGLYL